MSVDIHRGRNGGVAETDLDLFGVGSLRDQQARARVPEVMEAERSQPRLLYRRQPVAPPEVVASQRMPLHGAEGEIAQGRLGEVVPKLVDKERWDRELAAAIHRLGRLDIPGSGRPDLFQGADDLNRRVQQIQAGPLEPHQLSPPTPEVGGRQHERSERRCDRVGETLDLFGGEEALFIIGRARERDVAAGRFRNQPCVNGCRHRRRQQPVALLHRVRSQARLGELLDPGAHVGLCDPSERSPSEGRQNVVAQVAVIPCLRGGPAVELGAPVLLGPVAEGSAGELGIGPRPPLLVRLDRSKKGARLRLGLEAARAGAAGGVPVYRLVAAAVSFANGAQRLPPGLPGLRPLADPGAWVRSTRRH